MVAQELADAKEAYAGLSRDAITRHGLIGAIFHAPPSVLDKLTDALQSEQAGSSSASLVLVHACGHPPTRQRPHRWPPPRRWKVPLCLSTRGLFAHRELE